MLIKCLTGCKDMVLPKYPPKHVTSCAAFTSLILPLCSFFPLSFYCDYLNWLNGAKACASPTSPYLNVKVVVSVLNGYSLMFRVWLLVNDGRMSSLSSVTKKNNKKINFGFLSGGAVWPSSKWSDLTFVCIYLTKTTKKCMHMIVSGWVLMQTMFITPLSLAVSLVSRKMWLHWRL